MLSLSHLDLKRTAHADGWLGTAYKTCIKIHFYNHQSVSDDLQGVVDDVFGLGRFNSPRTDNSRGAVVRRRSAQPKVQTHLYDPRITLKYGPA